MIRVFVGALLVAQLLACVQSGRATTAIARECHIGIYGLSSSFLVVTKAAQGFRYAFSDGRVGAISDRSLVRCVGDGVQINQKTTLSRQPIEVTNTRFTSGDVELAGQLIQPPDANPETPLVVYAHGSEEWGWIESMRDPYQMVGRGVSVFIYDKRGTGQSDGAYTQNFPQLADDLVAASIEAKRLAGDRYGRFGLFGLSQGGWIAPLAADRAQAEYIGIGYGLVVDILEEDASQVALELREAGFDDDVIATAKSITGVTARLAVSGYRDGLEELTQLQQRYGGEPWFSTIRGGFSGVILGMSADELSSHGIPMFDRLDIDWSLVPLEVLRDVSVPQLWVLAEDDREAPMSTTLERLRLLRAEGKAISVSVFPRTDHGMWEYRQSADGSRQTTRVTDGFYDLMADWAKGHLQPSYGNAQWQ